MLIASQHACNAAYRAVTTIKADEATALSEFLKMENEIKGKKERERETGGTSRRT